MKLFYVPNILGDKIVLNETESRHAIKVLRLEKGEEVYIVDGIGGFHNAVVTVPHPKKCELQIKYSQHKYGEKKFHLHIAIAPTKNIDRFEWFLEKSTEIGIDEITPLLCKHSERKNIKTDRLNKILISAMKQSLKAYLPKLNPLTNYAKFIKNYNSSLKFIAHCQNNYKIHLKDAIKKDTNVIILIGPEGDFSQQEIDLANQTGYKEISLGNSRLRTETAGVVACHIVNLMQ